MIIAASPVLSLLNVIRSFKTVPLDYLASHFRKSPDEMRGELKALEAANVIRIDKEIVTLIDPAK